MNTEIQVDSNGWQGKSRRQVAALCESRLRKGDRRDALFQEMLSGGCSRDDAEEIMAESVRALTARGRKVLTVGVLFLAAGVLITVATYQTAYRSGGGQFVVCIGAVACGIFCVSAGLRSIARLR
jgi:hypothetical protein